MPFGTSSCELLPLAAKARVEEKNLTKQQTNPIGISWYHTHFSFKVCRFSTSDPPTPSEPRPSEDAIQRPNSNKITRITPAILDDSHGTHVIKIWETVATLSPHRFLPSSTKNTVKTWWKAWIPQTTLGSSYKSPATCLDAKLVPSDWDIWDLNWTQHCCNTATSKLRETIWNAHLFLQSESDIAPTCMFTTSWKEANTSQHQRRYTDYVHLLFLWYVESTKKIGLWYTHTFLSKNVDPRTAATKSLIQLTGTCSA